MLRKLLCLSVAALALAACTESSPAADLGSVSSPAPIASASPSADPSPSPAAAAAAAASGTSSAGCVADPMAHVYNADRLAILAPCVTVTGTVAVIRTEADGDYHVLVRLDTGQLCAGQDCLNAVNVSQQQSDLVVEPVCEHSISQSDAVEACAGYHNPLAVPAVGAHVKVTGPWVYDKDHGWNEIHPVESFGTLPAQPASAPPRAPAPTALRVAITASRYGYVSATTSAGAICTAQAKLPSGRISTAAGLQVSDTAGSDGAVSWTYRTSSTTNPGTGTHTVTCQLNGRSASASAPFTVS